MATRWRMLLVLLTAAGAGAAALVENRPLIERQMPPPGIAVPAADRAALEAGAAALGAEIEALRSALAGRPSLLELLPDVQIFHNAVRYALQYDEFYTPREITAAGSMLQQGMERARQLREGNAPWESQTGLVVRGYLSRIDGSVQPYGMVVPASYDPKGAMPHRLDLWYHGRGEKLTELSFLMDRERSPGQFAPPHAFVLHPYGRYCNANRFAGEVDTFEALDHARKHYRIDENRISVRGFSMGGAACWQYATHFPGLWAAAAPGAGFTDTADFLRIYETPGGVLPTAFEKRLWHLYDMIDYAANLSNLPTVAYSGEIDGARRCTDLMGKAMAEEGIAMVHIIGPQTGHAYHPQSREEINRRLDSIIARGRNPMPSHVRFTTWTLRYHEMNWVKLDGLEQHWERARVDAEILSPTTVQVKTQNVFALTLAMVPGQCPLDDTQRPTVHLDDQKLTAPSVLSDRSWTVHFRKNGNRWSIVDTVDDGTLRKRPGLQGPIDDAFMDSFLMVRPTGTPLNATSGAWVATEQKHAIEAWAVQFRGEARVKDDEAVTDADIAQHNLILWGDPSSNKVLAKIADKLPIRWNAQAVTVGSESYPSEQHVPVFIYPNPLNPKRYVVINSGFTFREYDTLNNARQTPKLPDYAVVDISVPPSSRWPGRIASAGFFGERWELSSAAGRAR